MNFGLSGNVGMVCFKTKEEASTAIQDLNETLRYIAKEDEPKKQRKKKSKTKKKFTPSEQNKMNEKATN